MPKTKKKSIQYFTSYTDEAIVAYNTSVSLKEKNKIYYEKIHPAFFKLTENIIHTFKFYYTEVDNIEDLQHEVIIFLLSKIHLFDPSKGAKAYSYFGTIAKRYLIINNTKNYKKRVDKIPIENVDDDANFSYTIDTDSNNNEKLYWFIDQFTEHCTTNIYNIFPKENDAKIADAILELFRKREHIDIFNKKALYIYIREIIDAKTPKITKIANLLYSIFKNGYSYYLEYGYVKF
jgi:DNA-directed RNA polymerase specialized sigma24 family protein